jgi:hypothetical protein
MLMCQIVSVGVLGARMRPPVPPLPSTLTPQNLNESLFSLIHRDFVLFVQLLIQARDSDMFPVGQEKFIRQTLREFPYLESESLQGMIHTLSKTQPGHKPTGLEVKQSRVKAFMCEIVCEPKIVSTSDGKFHDQGDAKWIVIRRPLKGHNDTPFGRIYYLVVSVTIN